ncbi:Dynamin-like GTPase that mediates homotypic ER fusion [Trichoglossum hirsutum]|uniref:Dynamin-like GTPase that mediates homotypic ER fusion n=1 Tax=Trichoglossum hirsutum TaxID=265104 RepID=A0A9P8ICF4_9PEZI|nr:Dynamin-like GTPase that mediates homotypic ER fusion [Trichoglossum hirsutum]
MTVLSETKSQDLGVRFKKMADGVYVEAKRSAIGGVAQIPLYFYGLLLALGWNEMWAAYVTYTLNLWGPMLRMANAASQQALEVGKERLREFLDGSEIARRPVVMREKGIDDDGDAISLQNLDGQGRRKHRAASLRDEDENDDI